MTVNNYKLGSVFKWIYWLKRLDENVLGITDQRSDIKQTTLYKFGNHVLTDLFKNNVSLISHFNLLAERCQKVIPL